MKLVISRHRDSIRVLVPRGCVLTKLDGCPINGGRLGAATGLLTATADQQDSGHYETDEHETGGEDAGEDDDAHCVGRLGGRAASSRESGEVTDDYLEIVYKIGQER